MISSTQVKMCTLACMGLVRNWTSTLNLTPSGWRILMSPWSVHAQCPSPTTVASLFSTAGLCGPANKKRTWAYWGIYAWAQNVFIRACVARNELGYPSHSFCLVDLCPSTGLFFSLTLLIHCLSPLVSREGSVLQQKEEVELGQLLKSDPAGIHYLPLQSRAPQEHRSQDANDYLLALSHCITVEPPVCLCFIVLSCVHMIFLLPDWIVEYLNVITLPIVSFPSTLEATMPPIVCLHNVIVLSGEKEQEQQHLKFVDVSVNHFLQHALPSELYYCCENRILKRLIRSDVKTVTQTLWSRLFAYNVCLILLWH